MSNRDFQIDQLRDKLARQEKELKLLEEKNAQVEKERDEYLQNVSHQLVAPLNAIKWHIENITQARIGVDRAQKVLRSIYSQATLAVHLAKNFKLMSNLNADHSLRTLKEPLQEVNLCNLLINLADDFQPLAWDQEIQIEVETIGFDSFPPVLAMKPLISQVFSNILENAVKYSNKKSRIIIKGKLDKDNEEETVYIQNQGISLTEEEAKHVFDRGYRSEPARAKYPAGTGFGLYIARRIIELHEGDIRVRSLERGWTVYSEILSINTLEGKARTRERKDSSIG